MNTSRARGSAGGGREPAERQRSGSAPPPHLGFESPEVLTFDCYGTLIDWEAGILRALRPVLAARGAAPPDREVLERYAGIEPVAQRGAYRPYRAVLAEVVRRLGAHYGFRPEPEEERVLVDSIGSWPPFPDTVDALRRLKERYRLGVISNVDEDLFEATAARLGVRFDHVVTAERARAYKPDPRPFRVALEEMGTPADRVLHVAQSLFHDIVPARALGLRCAWVDRRAGRKGGGATPAAEAGAHGRPDLTVPDLRSLASMLGAR